MKFKVGDTVRRITMDNYYGDGRTLYVGDIAVVTRVGGYYMDVVANNTVYPGCDPQRFELVDTNYPEHMNCRCSVNPLAIKNVIFNPPATIILWNDGTKSVVKCQNGEPYDAEKGFALAYLKKLLGNGNTFNKEINKWVTYEPPKVEEVKPKSKYYNGYIKCVDNSGNELGYTVGKTYKVVDGKFRNNYGAEMYGWYPDGFRTFSEWTDFSGAKWEEVKSVEVEEAKPESKYYNGYIKCTYPGINDYTLNKIYHVIDGAFIDDCGDRIPPEDFDRFESFEHLCDWSSASWEEVK